MITEIIAFFTTRFAVLLSGAAAIVAVFLGIRQEGKIAEKAKFLEKNNEAMQQGHKIENEINSLSDDDPKRLRLRKEWTRD